MKDKIPANLSGISCGGLCRIKDDEVSYEGELLGIMGYVLPSFDKHGCLISLFSIRVCIIQVRLPCV